MLKNMVDERMELIALICRLAERPEFSSPQFGCDNTDYHKTLAKTFAPYANHKAVAYVRKHEGVIHFDKVPRFAVHTEKINGKFVFIKNINSLFVEGWDKKTADEFLQLFNQFYTDSGFEGFFNSHTAFYEESTRKFVEGHYGKIDFAWFAKYVDTTKLRCIYSLSCGYCNYAPRVNDKIIYCVAGSESPAIIHEYCHFFGNPVADLWYKQNPEFKKLCDGSVNNKTMPFYADGYVMAREYVTRAFDVLYHAQHGGDVNALLLKEKNAAGENNFKYIEQVYAMVVKYDEKCIMK
jgi:hypothetical protein